MFIDGLPVHFTYDGDLAEVGKWLPFAKNLFSGLPRRGLIADEQVPAEGVFVRVLRMGGANKIYIKAGGCPPFISGLFDLILPSKPISIPPDITWDQSDAEGRRFKTTYRLFARTDKNGVEHYGPWDYSRELARNYTRDDPSKSNSLLFKTPGKYTGEMRKVAQVLIGQGQPVPYDYMFQRSHGIFQMPGGKPWVVEVSRANGVVAWRLPTCSQAGPRSSDAHKRVIDAIGYYPVAGDSVTRSLSEAVKAGRAIRLLPAESLTPFYDNTAFFPECGWAFSPNGSECQNTCWNHEGTWKRSYRYKITITSVDSAPAAATLTLEDEGYLHGPVEPDIKFPNYTLSTLTSFDTLYGQTGNPPPGQGDAPLYVFYDHNGAEVLVKYYVQSNTTSNTVDDGVPSSPPTAAEIRKGEFLNGVEQSYLMQGPGVAGIPRPTYTTYSGSLYSFYLGMRPDRAVARLFGGPSDWSISTESADVTRRFLAGNSGRTTHSEFSVVIPFLDRETAMFAERRIKHLFAGSAQRYYWIALTGPQITAGIGDGGCDVVPWPSGAQRRIHPSVFELDLVTNYVRSGMVHYLGPTVPCAFVSTPDLGPSLADDFALDTVLNFDEYTDSFKSVLLVNPTGSYPLGSFQSDSIVHAVAGDSYAHCVTDCFSNQFFASRELNAIAGPDYSGTAMTSAYPISELPNGVDRFFVGVP